MKSHALERQKLEELIRLGEDTFLDGVMSPQTTELIERFGSVGIDMSPLWVCTPQDWSCPGCGRHKAQIARLNKNGALMCRIVEHHDHMAELLKRRFVEKSSMLKTVVADQVSEEFAKRSASMVASFENAAVCDDCNVADINAKKASDAHKDFSFSPSELNEIVEARDNQPHSINREKAIEVWSVNRPTFELRLKIVDRIAEIAATNQHWFQPIGYGFRPSVIEERARAHAAARGVWGPLDFLAGPKPPVRKKPLNAWRHVKPKRSADTPTTGQIQHVARVKSLNCWNQVEENWSCPGCGRSKVEIVRRTNNGEWAFNLGGGWYRSSSADCRVENRIICSDCSIAAQKLGREARSTSGIDGIYCASIVEVAEVSRIALSAAHSKHWINNAEADALIPVLISRLKAGEGSGNFGG